MAIKDFDYVARIPYIPACYVLDPVQHDFTRSL
jgi:hypothetical protein